MNETMTPTAGARLASWRLLAGYRSQAAAARAASLHDQTVANAETGRKPLSLDSMRRLSSLYGVGLLEMIQTCDQARGEYLRDRSKGASE